MKLWNHMRYLWPRFTIAPTIPFWGWAVFWLFRGHLRWDHVAVAALLTGLAYSTVKTKRLFVGLLPVALVGLLYDAMRFVKNVGLSASRVHLCDLRDAELRWFGINVAGTRVTLHDWLQAHATTWLDVACAIPYGTFLWIVVAYAIFLFVRDFRALQRFTWGFLALNVAGFLTYHIYPAAPPWYYHQYGCAVDLTAAPGAGPNLLRVDALLGLHYYASYYGRASDVFGAVPSLHVAYPLLMITQGWHLHRAWGRTLLVAFYVWLSCSAVYLDHHWVIDILAGSVYALVTALGIHGLDRWRHSHWGAGLHVPPQSSNPRRDLTGMRG